ncbi:metallophosphoesterase family protein [Pseudoflavonifractor phocaeensis]|uniref:metallophosphoesterase family protein n=1 Tax=Pseudoflavonifractor phocaeensis TaxID=1870988 RepID=UPI00195EF64D|nr:metallophosphoesterase [Pseudoflavonifractor phocaeensis]MBM6927305.1 metallophosphoesterase [Pseudoflavonifractor phocaeensis]
MRMLHLSDLHFGSDPNATTETQRMNLLNQLLKLPELETVDVVLVTGDVAWHCSDEGYAQATEWFNKLRGKVRSSAKFVGCCGNHDVNQNKCKELQYISSVEKIRETLKLEELDNLQGRFEKYISFCKENCFEQLALKDVKNYLVGSMDITIDNMNLRFCVFNSAWYALKGGEEDKGHLWLGRNFYDMLDMERTSEKQTYVITVMHHPKEWLNENEMQTEGDNYNKSLFELISADSHFCFTGHTHGNIQPPNLYHNHMLTFSSGATYAETTYHHNFSFYDLDKEENTITRIPFESVDQKEWKRYDESCFLIDVQNGANGSVSRNATEKSKTEETIDANVWNGSRSTRFYETLEKIGVQLIRVSNHDFSVNKTVIWPVVPRNTLTTIHLAQLELMAILCRDFGWSVNAIISNCGSHPQSEDQVSAFEQKIHQYCRYVGIEKFECSSLDSYFKPEHVLAADVLGSFIRFSSLTNVPKLRNIKIKRYASDKQQKNIRASSSGLHTPAFANGCCQDGCPSTKSAEWAETHSISW